MSYPTAVETAADLPYLSPFGEGVPPGIQPGDLLQELRDRIFTLQTEVGATGGDRRKHTWATPAIDIDNGAGTTRDFCFNPSFAITIRAIRIVYQGATSGTVASATVKIGTAVGGEEIVASTALEDSKAVGVTTSLTPLITAIAANQAVFVRHTGIAATAAGEYTVEIEYTID